MLVQSLLQRKFRAQPVRLLYLVGMIRGAGMQMLQGSPELVSLLKIAWQCLGTASAPRFLDSTK